MAKWADKKITLSQATQSQEEHIEAPDRQNSGPGNQVDARIALMNSIADNADEVRAEDMRDVSTEDYEDGALSPQEKQELKNRQENPGGKVFPRVTAAQADEVEDSDAVEENADEVTDEPAAEVKKYKIKVNGLEKEFTEAELIAKAQKVDAADQYLAEAAKMYSEAKQPPSKKDAAAEIDPNEEDLAQARALQMGTEEDAAKILRTLKKQLSTDAVKGLVQTEVLQINQTMSAKSRFEKEYGDLLGDADTRQAIFDRDEYLAFKGQPASYERYKQAAEDVRKLKGTPAGSFEEKEQRKAAVKIVTGNSARKSGPVEEKEPTTTDVIASMAKARGQFVASH